MKTLIDNRTNLSYEEIGSILDCIQEKENWKQERIKIGSNER